MDSTITTIIFTVGGAIIGMYVFPMVVMYIQFQVMKRSHLQLIEAAWERGRSENQNATASSPNSDPYRDSDNPYQSPESDTYDAGNTTKLRGPIWKPGILDDKNRVIGQNFPFFYLGKFKIMMIRMNVWENAARSTFFVEYLLPGKTFFGFITYFDQEILLESGTNLDSLLFPQRPGCYHQTFVGFNHEDLWVKHLEAARYLVGNGARLIPNAPLFPWVRPQNGPPHYEEPLSVQVAVNRSVQIECRYVSSHWFWPLRWPIWFIFRRHFLKNKSVEQLVQSGKLFAPQDLPFNYKEWTE